MQTERVVTLDEVRKHNKRGDLWVVVHGCVFDVSQWMEGHPGGWEILLGNADGAENAVQYENIRHSADARAKAKELLVGRLPDATPSKFPMDEGVFPLTSQGGTSFTKQKPRPAAPPSDDGLGPMILAVGAAVAVAAGVAYYLLQQSRKA